jgi:site-specific DNA recombinase
MEPAKASSRRCAIYTRKSSEEGLEQDFNSLQAQREACEAFIKSQAGEGWRLVKTAYDDGGLSGGTMERPALQRLLGDINQGLIDVAVVYKVDRLTRSLADFAKMVEVFDAHGVSFVAVTQQFNTTTSMGRLTLNVLLSFAQFEREVTGEGIRDKIAASKRKGMWMGGVVPLGYDVCDRRIVIDEREAETVRPGCLLHGFFRLPGTPVKVETHPFSLCLPAASYITGVVARAGRHSSGWVKWATVGSA